MIEGRRGRVWLRAKLGGSKTKGGRRGKRGR